MILVSKNNDHVVLSSEELVLELTILHSQTRCELELKTKLSFLTSTEALRRPWVIFIKR